MRVNFLYALLAVLLFNINNYTQIQLQQAFPNLTFSSPVDLQHAGDGTDRIFIVEQAGVIKVFQNDPSQTSAKVFLNITDRVNAGGEMGLLGLAFHPQYKLNGYFYVNYTTNTPQRRTVVSRFQVSSDPDSADNTTELIIITQNQPYTNHNGGQIQFGPDGNLYIALGDGGSGGDPQNYGQTLSTLLGKIVRISVDSTQAGLNYGIPWDNPFKGNIQGYKEEIYAFGLRNPWRFSFDFTTGWLWCGDVGQNALEEIDVIVNGGNYGWRCYEGTQPYNLAGCTGTDYLPPVWEYPRSEGYSVTGGYVYRGPNLPEIFGKYIYADYGSRKIWSLEYDGINPPQNTLLTTASGGLPSFGVDQNNELYICSFDGKIYRFTPTAAIIAPSNLKAELIFNPPDASVLLSWNDNSANETGFKIERKINSGSYELLDSVAANVTEYSDVNISDSVTYSYRVYAFNESGNSGYSNEASLLIAGIPVELYSFTAEVSGNAVTLKWFTASETNSSGFEVERYLNDNWMKIGFVSSSGTTTDRSSYSFTDDFGNNGFEGVVKYRLKMIDQDGSFTYSNEVEVDLNIPKIGYFLRQNYPNPFNPVTNFSYNLPEESQVKVQIINMLGESVLTLTDEVQRSGTYNQTWDAGNFSSGIYFLRLTAGSMVTGKVFIHSIKMMYLK
jgi:glucose/arabinose dehydrogenase